MKTVVLQVEERFANAHDVAVTDGCWLRRCHCVVSKTIRYVCTSQSIEEPAEIVGPVPTGFASDFRGTDKRR